MEAAIEAAVRKVVREELLAFRSVLLADLRGSGSPNPFPPPGGGDAVVPSAGEAVQIQDVGLHPGALGLTPGSAAKTPGGGSRAQQPGGPGENGGTPGSNRRGWTKEMEMELYALLQQQTKGVPGVTEDRIAWQVIRAVSETMSHLSKDAIRKKGKRMLQRLDMRQHNNEPDSKRFKGEPSQAAGQVPAAAAHPAQAFPALRMQDEDCDEEDDEEDAAGEERNTEIASAEPSS